MTKTYIAEKDRGDIRCESCNMRGWVMLDGQALCGSCATQVEHEAEVKALKAELDAANKAVKHLQRLRINDLMARLADNPEIVERFNALTAEQIAEFFKKKRRSNAQQRNPPVRSRDARD